MKILWGFGAVFFTFGLSTTAAAEEEWWGLRNRAKDRPALLKRYGGSEKTEEAVELALRWLQRHQSEDGRWDGDGFKECCKDTVCPSSQVDYDVGLTGLALLAFLGRGETHQVGAFSETVENGIFFLLRSLLEDGMFGVKTEHYLYNHSLATYAVAEAYAMTADPNLKASLQRAVDFLIRAQNPEKGWRYRNYNGEEGPEDEGGRNDTSVTAWVVMALGAAREGGIELPASVFKGANRFLDTVQAKQGGRITFGYYAPNLFMYRKPYVTTAAGALTRQFTGFPDEAKDAIPVLTDHLPDRSRKNFYEWYFSTLAVFQHGGERWRTWNVSLQKELLRTQERGEGACREGSWDPQGDRWGPVGGRVYTTACGALCLEVYYRYPMVLPKRFSADFIRRIVCDRLKDSKEDRETFERLLAELSDDDFRVREKGIDAMVGQLLKYKPMVEEALVRRTLSVDVRGRLEHLMIHFLAREDEVITRLLRDKGYLISILPKVSGDDRTAVLKQLRRLTERDLGEDSDAWKAWWEDRDR